MNIRFLACWTCCGAALLAAGCQTDKSGEVESQAKVLLSIGKPQEALEKLDKSSTASGHFLKALALTRLNLPDPALDQLQKALALDPENAVYRAYQLGMKMQEGNQQAVDDLLKIYEQNKSSAPIALFAASAYARKNDAVAALSAFRTGIALSQEAPEFLPQMLIYATHAHLAPEAKTILEKLMTLSPNDAHLARQRVQVLLMVRDYDDAIRYAREIDEAQNHSLESAALYAGALAQAPATAERERALLDLVQKDPQNLHLKVLYCTFLAQANRVGEALEFLNKAIDEQPVESAKMLIHTSISLPLAAKNGEAAYAQLQRYRDRIEPALFITYYEGRILHLRKDYKGALASLAKVVDEAKDDTEGSRVLAKEALSWIQIIEFDKRVAADMKQAADKALHDSPSKTAKKPPSDAKKTESGS